MFYTPYTKLKNRLSAFSIVGFFLISSVVFGDSAKSILKNSAPTFAQEIQLKKEVSRYKVFKINPKGLKALFEKNPEALSFPIQIDDQTEVVLQLRKVEIKTGNFSIETTSEKKYLKTFEENIHYQGKIEGFEKSLAALSFNSKEISGIFSLGTGNYNLVSLKNMGGNPSQYVLFNDRDAIRKNPFNCHSGEIPKGKNSQEKISQLEEESVLSGNCKRVEIFFECDYKTYQDNGSSVPNTINWLTSMFNFVAAIYSQTGITISISGTFIHISPDDYPEENSQSILFAFGDALNTRGGFNGNLAHLISTKPLALGGIAFLDVLCTDGTGYSNVYTSFLPLPMYSWNINVIAHELGHNFGSPHTQSCTWELAPGEFGMLDSCFTPEGDCYFGPRIAKVGTVMSYCHLMNLGVDLSLGFGPKPAALILNSFNNASSCLNGTVDLPPLTITKPDTYCIGSNVQLSVTPVAGATYQWTGPNGFNATASNPVINSVSTNSEGSYRVIVSKSGCSSPPFETKISVNCISAVNLTNQKLCSNASFPIGYVSKIQANAGNVFTAQLSDVNGSFANPKILGSISTTSSKGSISAILPSDVVPGSGYKFRVVSSNPARTGESSKQNIQVLPKPVAPNGTNVNGCNPGIYQISASALPGNQIRWYSSESSGTILGTGNTFQTPTLNTTTSFWAESILNKKETVGPTLSDPLLDSALVFNTYHGIFIKVKENISIDSITFWANGAGILKFNIKDSANTITYRSVSIPLLGNQSSEKKKIGIELSPGVYRIDAQGSTVSQLLRLNNFFDYPIEGQGLDILGSSVASRYYFFFDMVVTSFGCVSQRKELKVLINPISAPTVSGSQKCGAGTVTLSASGALAGQSYRWYSTATGGNSIPGQTGSTFITPVLNGTTTYYASIFSSTTCESTRVPVVATINPIPNAPLGIDSSRCGAGTITLKASGATVGQTYRWYTTSSGGSPIAGQTNFSYLSPVLNSTTTFYSSIVSNQNCESSRTPVLATINAIPNQPIASDSSRCGPGILSLKASGATVGQNYVWFNSTSGPPIAGQTGSTFVTPLLASSDSFYVSVNSQFCQSSRVRIIARINPVPNPPTGSDSSRCGPGTVNLKASGTGTNSIFKWYTLALGGSALPGQTNPNLTTPTLNATTTYYVSEINAFNCESNPRKAIKAIIKSIPQAPVLSLSGGFLVAGFDTLYQWFKDGVALGQFSDSLPITQFGPGTYVVELRKSNLCFSISNPVVVTSNEAVAKIKSGIELFPNPARDLVYIQTELKGKKDVKLFDGLGKIIHEYTFDNEAGELSIKNLAAGLYIVRVQSENQITQIRLVKK